MKTNMNPKRGFSFSFYFYYYPILRREARAPGEGQIV